MPRRFRFSPDAIAAADWSPLFAIFAAFAVHFSCRAIIEIFLRRHFRLTDAASPHSIFIIVLAALFAFLFFIFAFFLLQIS